VSDYDVIVVGAGNAALAAAVSAREQGAVAAGGRRPSLADYVMGTGPRRGAPAARVG
jgi:thioredoxin reductase